MSRKADMVEELVPATAGDDGLTGSTGLTASAGSGDYAVHLNGGDCSLTATSGTSSILTGSTGLTAPTTLNGYVDRPFIWNKDEPPGPQSDTLCKRLQETGSLFHTADGQILRLKVGTEPKPVSDAVDLEAFIREHFPVVVLSGGKACDRKVPPGDLKVLLRSPVLQGSLPVVDRVTEVPTFNSDWQLTRPGYNDGPHGERIFYTGKPVQPKLTPERIREFIGVMAWKSQADATNAIGLALTVLLRLRWPGQKPFGAITATKSHSGKDTVADFITGPTQKVEVSWSRSDWPLQNESVSALVDPNIGVLVLGNIRSGTGIIESAFIERIVTSPQSLMQSSKRRGDGYKRDGDFVVLATANNGKFSTDLANRSCPVHLEQHGDINGRVSAIGDPRHEFLPACKDEILAELCGMVERWTAGGCLPDDSVRHPMREWSRTIGGILKANGFEGFLANWSMQRNANDTVRESLARIGLASPPDTWLRVDALHKDAEIEGVIGRLMDRTHRESDRSVQQELGRLLSVHQDETLTLETDDGVKSFILRKDRNAKTGQFATVYMFQTPS